jgi:UDP-glucose 4-epimerase
LAQNTRGLPEVLVRLCNKGLRAVVLTGSVFEQNEGAGDMPLRAFSPYGLSKGFTADTFRYWCGEQKVQLGKFVIPNPFGPFEEPRFCAYLIKCWKDGKTAEVRTPRYIRDNVPVDLLAAVYTRFCEQIGRDGAAPKLNPSCYAETQGAFTARFSGEMEKRLGYRCPFTLLNQTDFPEPLARINMDPAISFAPNWDEAGSWDRLASYYMEN